MNCVDLCVACSNSANFILIHKPKIHSSSFVPLGHFSFFNGLRNRGMIKNKAGLMFLVSLHKSPRLPIFPLIGTPKVNSFSFKYTFFTGILVFQIQNQRSNYFMSHGTHLHGAAESLQSTSINTAAHVVHIQSIWIVFLGPTQSFMQIYITVGFKKQSVLRVPFPSSR